MKPLPTARTSQGRALLALALALLPAALAEAGADMRPSGPPQPVCPPTAKSRPSTKPPSTVVIRHYDPPACPPDVGGQDKGKDKIQLAVRALDRLHAKVEEWGVATISAPIAVLESNVFAVPSEIVSPRELYDSARTDVDASVAVSTAREITNTMSAIAAFATPKPPKDGTTAPTAGAAGTPVDVTPRIPSITTAADIVNHMTVKKSSGASLRDAMDNTMRERLYAQMSKPKPIPEHSRVIFAIVQVSCNPGWRTKEKYIADCSASMEYYDMCREKQLSRAALTEPTVFSVLPLVDAQTIEMANSQRDVTQLAFDLAASLPGNGVSVNAKDVFKFVKQYARDIKSVTPVPVVNSYSTGATFGFRFSPSFLALADPAQKNSRAANVLLPTTFPALITVVMYHRDVRVAGKEFARKRKEEGISRAEAPESGFVPGMAILAHTSTRWYIKDAGCRLKRIFDPLKRDTANIEIGAASDVAVVYDAKEAYARGDLDEDNRSTRMGRGHYNPVYEEIRREIIDLESKGVGRSWPIPLDRALVTALDKVPAENPEVKKVTQERDEAKELLAAAKQQAVEDLNSLKRTHLEQENAFLKNLLLNGTRHASNDEAPAAREMNPGPARKVSLEPPVTPPASLDGPVDERVLALDDTLLPAELQGGAFPVAPPAAARAPQAAPVMAGAPRRTVPRATPESALPLPKKAAASALKPYLVQGRETPPFRR